MAKNPNIPGSGLNTIKTLPTPVKPTLASAAGMTEAERFDHIQSFQRFATVNSSPAAKSSTASTTTDSVAPSGVPSIASVNDGELLNSASDSDPGFLSSKLTSDSTITLTTTNPGANEQLKAAIPPSATNGQVLTTVAGSVAWAAPTSTLSGHVISTGSTPSGVAGSYGTAPAMAGNDTAGTITLTGSAAPGVGTLVVVTFASAYAVAPRVVLTASTLAAALCMGYVSAINTAGFTISCAVAASASATLGFNYVVIQ